MLSREREREEREERRERDGWMCFRQNGAEYERSVNWKVEVKVEMEMEMSISFFFLASSSAYIPRYDKYGPKLGDTKGGTGKVR